MESIVLTQSQCGNKYLYETFNKKLTNISNTTYELYQTLSSAIKEERDIFLQLKEKHPDISPKEIFNFLENYGGIDKNEELNIKTEISEEIVKHYMANFPQIVFEVTEKCNLNCKYCTYGDFYDGNTTRSSVSLDVVAALKLVDYIYAFCVSKYATTAKNIINISFYGGEPLLRFSFIKEITDYAKSLESNNVFFQFSMTTNATLLKKHIAFLAENQYRILISLDGNEENHSYRIYHNGRNSFNDVYENVCFVKENYPEYFIKYVNFNSVLHDRNSVAEANDFIKRNFGKNPILSEISTDGLKEDRKKELLELYKNKSEDLQQSEDYYRLLHKENVSEVPDFKEAMYFIYNLTNLVYFNYTELFLDNKKSVKPTGTCLPFARKIFVTANGIILPCENVSPKFEFGRVDNKDVHIDFEKLINFYSGNLKKVQKLCQKCYRVTNCYQCMFYLNLEDDNIKCYGFMNEKKFAHYLGRIVTYLENNPTVFNKIITETSIS